jgi:hypothetical protein
VYEDLLKKFHGLSSGLGIAQSLHQFNDTAVESGRCCGGSHVRLQGVSHGAAEGCVALTQELLVQHHVFEPQWFDAAPAVEAEQIAEDQGLDQPGAECLPLFSMHQQTLRGFVQREGDQSIMRSQ